MKYELAKKLKDAGFPQEEGRGDIACVCEGYWEEHQKHKDNPPEVYVPTLSELIEATVKLIRDGDCGSWRFQLHQSKDHSWCSDTYYKQGVGTTPEEAVANLWLALNPQAKPEDK